MKINKGLMFKIIIIIVDIIALTLFIIACFKWFDKKMNHNEETDELPTYNFRKFYYTMHDGLDYSDVDEFKFKISTDDYEAIIMPYLSDEWEDLVPLSSYIPDYENYLKEHNINVVKTYTVDELDKYYNIEKEVYVLDIVDENNKMLCYYQTFSPFYYEIELINKSGEFDTDPLEEIVDALQDVYYDQETKKEFYYYTSTEVFHKFDYYA